MSYGMLTALEKFQISLGALASLSQKILRTYCLPVVFGQVFFLAYTLMSYWGTFAFSLASLLFQLTLKQTH